MNKKKKLFTEDDINEGYNLYSYYQSLKGIETTKEAFLKFRFRKYFIELCIKYKTYNTSIPINDYMKYIVDNNMAIKDWADINKFRNFILIYVKEEQKEPAISRSKQFLNEKGLTISTISYNRLVLYVESGSVSPWLIITEYPEFFEEINKEKGNVFCRNILNYYFWKSKVNN